MAILQTAKHFISIVRPLLTRPNDIFRLSDLLAAKKLEQVLVDGILKISSENDCTLTLRFLVLRYVSDSFFGVSCIGDDA